MPKVLLQYGLPLMVVIPRFEFRPIAKLGELSLSYHRSLLKISLTLFPCDIVRPLMAVIPGFELRPTAGLGLLSRR
jgi:hypothetical protein